MHPKGGWARGASREDKSRAFERSDAYDRSRTWVGSRPRRRVRRRLLVLFTPADHPHRDPACATLAWLAPAGGRLFECYLAGAASGDHFGGGHPAYTERRHLRGGPIAGGHHLEQLYRLLGHFECEAVLLGEGPFDHVLEQLEVPLLARAHRIEELYRQLLPALGNPTPGGILVVGRGGSPQGIPLTAYAYPEVVNRRLLAVSEGDPEALAALAPGFRLHTLWLDGPLPAGAEPVAAPAEATIVAQTAWMAERWSGSTRGYLFGDPEVVGRWTPAAVREGWASVFGLPQREAIELLEPKLRTLPLVHGRQQDDQDFLALSRAGVAFQLVDPGRPPFPVLKEAARPVLPPRVVPQDPSDTELESWANEGRVLVSLLFWTGMLRELENLYALADVLTATGAAVGLILTTASWELMPHPPLTLIDVDHELGGLAPRVEALLASAGCGAILESAAPPERFAHALKTSVTRLTELIGPERVPKGWWGVMDAPLVPRPPPRLSRQPDPPFVKLRYRGRGGSEVGPAPGGSGRRPGFDLRRLIRRSPVGRMLEPWRPFDAFAPGPPSRAVFEAVRDAGFEYAFTKSGFGGEPAVADIGGLTVLNHTVGRWDGWTPFVTVNSIADLKSAERRLLWRRRPGWLLGGVDSCLWAFSGERWRRGAQLRQLCAWVASGGSSGRLINVPPRVIARYARLPAVNSRVARLAPE